MRGVGQAFGFVAWLAAGIAAPVAAQSETGDPIAAASRRAETGDSAGAITAIKALAASPDRRLAARAELWLSEHLVEQDPPAAEAFARSAAKLFAALPDGAFDEGSAQANVGLAIAYQGKFAVGLPDLVAGARRMRDAAKTAEQREAAAFQTSMGALIANELGRRDQAVADQRLAMELLAANGSEGGALAAKTYANAADFAARNGDHEGAVRFGLQSVAILERVKGRDHPDLIDPLGVLGEAMMRAGRYGEAEPVLRRAVALAEARQDAPKGALMLALRNLGGLYLQTNRKVDGAAMLARAIAVGDADPVTAKFLTGTLKDLSVYHEERGELDEAKRLNLRAAAIEEATVGAQSPSRGQTLLNIAEIDLKRGDLSAAEAGARGVDTMYSAILEPSNPRRGDPLRILGQIAMERGDATAAATLLDQALSRMASRSEASLPLINTRMNAAQAWSRATAGTPRGWTLARGAADAMTGRLVGEAALVQSAAAGDQLRLFDSALDIAWQRGSGLR